MNEKPKLVTNGTDVGVALTKGVVSAFPYAGGFVAELVGTLVPNQRLDRVAKFLEILDRQVAQLEASVIADRARSDDFIALFDEALQQASRAASEDRKSYIASLLTTSLSQEQVEHIASKKLLSLLHELNDIEILKLQCFSLPIHQQRAFIDAHVALQIPSITATSSKGDIDAEAMHQAYRLTLVQLGLLTEDRKVTHLGRLLLRTIGLDRES